MSIDNELFEKAYELWTSFKEEVLYKNRFIIKHDVLDYLKHFAETNQVKIEKDTILYRARLFTDNDTYIKYASSVVEGLEVDDHLKRAYLKLNNGTNTNPESGFWGYDEKGSFVPSNNDTVNDGRANPAFIKYLYTAEDPYTSIVEVRPYLQSKISVAQIKINEPLTIADFTYDSFGKLEGFEQNLMYLIMSDFSKPTDSDKKRYIPTQYVAEYIKTLGIDGIKFNSSLYGRGRNITIFNYEKCKPVGSKLYEIEDICFEVKGIAPINEKNLIHYKLEAYKEKEYGEILKRLLEVKKEQ